MRKLTQKTLKAALLCFKREKGHDLLLRLKASGMTGIEYHRRPTPNEIRLGYGATHYKTFPLEMALTRNGQIKKRIKDDDGLLYFRF